MENLYPNDAEATTGGTTWHKPLYEPPKITVMNEEEVLSAFQITQAAISWWIA
jgi:hypothetical protein